MTQPPANPDPSSSLPTDDDAPWIPDEWLPKAPSSQKHSPKKRSSQKQIKQHSAQLFPIPSTRATDTATESTAAHRSEVGPLPLVETAFLASAASLMWLVNVYFPPGPFLRILFPLPIALVYLRWNLRAAWMSAIVSGLLLTILLGPTRSIFFVMPYGLLGVQLGFLWQRQARWEASIFTGGVLVAMGTFFRIWLLSLLAGEDLWGYLVAQITQFIDWAMRLLTNWGWIGLGALGQPSMELIAFSAVVMVLFTSIVYLFTVHLAAWLVLGQLGMAMPPPPSWVQVLIEE
ncbi:MAG: DUF2232 domain-containing protein [Cyanobacteria bacterium P01_D01_bin.105]